MNQNASPIVQTAAQWTSMNPILDANQRGLESDTGKEKIGDGHQSWKSLSYMLLAAYVPTSVGQVGPPSSPPGAGVPPIFVDSAGSVWAYVNGSWVNGGAAGSGPSPKILYQSGSSFRWSGYHQSKLVICGTAVYPYTPGTATVTGPGIASAVTVSQINGSAAQINVGDAVTSIRVSTGVGQTIGVGDQLTIAQSGVPSMSVIAQTAVAANTSNATVTTNGALCGTFTARSASILFDLQIDATNLGGAWGGVILMVGVTANPATTPLFAPLTFPIGSAGGVTQFQSSQVGSLDIDWKGGPPTRHEHVLSGFTPGTVYTWQVVHVIQSSSYSDILTNSIGGGRLAVSPDNNWLAASQANNTAVQLIHLGSRPGWSFGPGYKANQLGGQWVDAVQTAITVGAGPVSMAFSPDSSKLAVCNFTAGTVTFITVATGAVIGTSAVVHGASTNSSAVAWLADGTAVLVGQSDGSLNIVTAVASPVITNVATGLGTITQSGIIKRLGSSTTDNNFWVVTTAAIIQGHCPTDTTWTQDSTFTPTSMTGSPYHTVDGMGNLWAAINGGTFDKQIIRVAPGTTAVAANFTPSAGNAVQYLALTGDGAEIWVVANAQAGAFETNDFVQTQSWLAASVYQSLGTSPIILGLAMSSDGFIYVAANSTPSGGLGGPVVYVNPSSIINMVPGLPTGQGMAVAAVGAT